MKKAYSLLISLNFLCSTVYSETPAPATVETAVAPSASEAFVTLTRTAMPSNDLPTNTEVQTPDEFNGWSAETAGEAASRMTSVQINQFQGLAGAQTVQIRGASTSQSLVLIDGRPVGGIAFSGFQDMTEIPTEQIDHIEVVRGAASSLYGPNAMGGVLNVITKRGPSDGSTALSAGYDYGSYGRNVFRATAGSKMGPVDYFIYGDTQHEDGFRQNAKADTVNAGANLGIALPGASKLLVDGSWYQAEVGTPGKNSTPPNQFNNDIERAASSPVAKQDIDTKALRLAYSIPLPMNALLSVKAWGSDRRAIFKDTFSDSDTLQSSRGASAQVDLPLGLMVGSDFIHDREDTTDHFTPSNSFIAHTENYAFFAQDTMKWNVFTLIPSGRFDHNSVVGDNTNPRVQAMADAKPWLRFSGSSARAFRAPSIDDKYYPFTDFGAFPDFFSGRYVDGTFGGNPNIKGEKAWTYDAGFELHNEMASFKATYFRANVTNLIHNVELFTTNAGTLANPDVDAFTTVNVGEARRQGLEIQIDHKLNDYFKDGWNYTYLENVGKVFDMTTNRETPNFVTLSYSPRHTANWFATITPIKPFDFTNTLRYVDSQYSGDNKGGTKLGSRVLWDMRIAYRWQILESYFQVSNVTDKRYEEQAGYPLPGRIFIGGVTMHFGSSNPK